MAMINKYDIPGLFRDYATEKEWKYYYGSDEYMSAMSASDTFDVDELILSCSDWRVTPRASAQYGSYDDVTHTVTLMIGRKFEETTMASLDETMIQKHDRRMGELCELLVNMVDDISCTNNLSISFSAGVPLPNMWANNIDFFMFPITIEA